MMVNGSVALRHIKIGAVNAEAPVWGRNITNRSYSTGTLPLRQGPAANLSSRALSASMLASNSDRLHEL